MKLKIRLTALTKYYKNNKIKNQHKFKKFRGTSSHSKKRIFKKYVRGI